VKINSPLFASRENFGIYQNELTKDLKLDLKVLPDNLPPRVTYQNIDRPGIISLNFNEEIPEEIAKNTDNYEMQDLNVEHPETSDNPSIYRVDYSGKNLKIYVKGMMWQPQEHYGLWLKNFADLHGNITEPNPKKVTLVQKNDGTFFTQGEG
jgi:hypothetical protein